MKREERLRASTRIPLRFGERWLFAIVDEEDAHLGLLYWHAIESRGKYYARRAGSVYLHRQIMRVSDAQEIDHRNGDSLDCRRENLRIATRQQQTANARRPDHNSSGFKGVTKCGQRWRAFIKIDQKQKHLGVFDLKVDAAHAYDRAARELFGQFAKPNFE